MYDVYVRYEMFDPPKQHLRLDSSGHGDDLSPSIHDSMGLLVFQTLELHNHQIVSSVRDRICRLIPYIVSVFDTIPSVLLRRLSRILKSFQKYLLQCELDLKLSTHSLSRFLLTLLVVF